MIDIFNRKALAAEQEMIRRLNSIIQDKNEQIENLIGEIETLHDTVDRLEGCVFDAEAKTAQCRKETTRAHRRMFQLAVKNAELMRGGTSNAI